MILLIRVLLLISRTMLLKRFAETHFTRDRDLIRGHATLEEVGELLHVLKIHERKRILRAVDLLQTEHR